MFMQCMPTPFFVIPVRCDRVALRGGRGAPGGLFVEEEEEVEEKKYYCVQSNVAHYELFHALRPNPLLCQNSAEEVK